MMSLLWKGYVEEEQWFPALQSIPFTSESVLYALSERKGRTKDWKHLLSFSRELNVLACVWKQRTFISGWLISIGSSHIGYVNKSVVKFLCNFIRQIRKQCWAVLSRDPMLWLQASALLNEMRGNPVKWNCGRSQQRREAVGRRTEALSSYK